MADRPCTPEAGAANDLASTHVAGHRHRFRLGVDQPDYLRLLRCSLRCFGRAALHPSVTRRATFYESHPSWVSIQPRSRRRRRPIPAHVESLRGPNRPHGADRELHHECRGRRCGGVHRGCADPRVELVFRRLHAWTLPDRPRGSQPVGNVPLCQDVSGRVGRCPGCRMRLPTARRNSTVGALFRGLGPSRRTYPADHRRQASALGIPRPNSVTRPGSASIRSAPLRPSAAVIAGGPRRNPRT